jgi:nucleoside-diphosphate-sugar epimerase
LGVSSSISIPRRVFITGANGFIGSALARRYRELGSEVRGLDMVADPACNVVASDVREVDRWRAHLDGCDLVIHTAAVVSMVAPMPVAWDVNCNGTRRLLSACCAAGVARFVHLSSVAAYGRDFPDGVDESWPLVTNGNSYTDTKITGEHAVLAAHAGGEASCTIIRPGDVYGPGSRAWIVEPIKAIRARQFLLPDRGRGIFSPVYIDDLVDGVVAAAGLAQGAGQVFNLTSGVGVSCAEFFGHHWRWVGRRGAMPSLPTGLAVALAEASAAVARLVGRPTEMGRGTIGLLSRRGTYSIGKARRLLGYTPKIDLGEGMRRSEAWARATGLVGAS